MTLRAATVDDIDAIAAIAHAQRRRQHLRDPAYWPAMPDSTGVHSLLLRWLLTGGASTALVIADAGETVLGYVIASAVQAPGSLRKAFVIDALDVAGDHLWPTLGPPLLAATAGRAKQQGVTTVIVACPTDDTARRAVFASCRFEVDCWFRHGHLGTLEAVVPPAAADDDDEMGLPLPHLHGRMASLAEPFSVVAPGAHSLISAPVPLIALVPAAGTTTLVDPAIGSDRAAFTALFDEIEGVARSRGDLAVTVAVGPGEEPLDRCLQRRGYSRPIDWWSLRTR